MNGLKTQHNFINGEWQMAGTAVANINPSDLTDTIGEFASGNADEMISAIEAAEAAFKIWRNTSPQIRCDLLDKVGNEIISRKDEIGALLSREEGKILAEGIGETVRAGQIFKYFAQEALRNAGDAIASVRPGVDVDVTREPVGVIGIITPWNFPIAIPAWKIAPALAYGNTIVFKPAELTPACSYIVAEILDKSGCPAGVFNLVCGAGRTVGQAIVDHPAVTAISFTGSVAVGRQIAASAVGGMKKVQLEMGGKNPMVVLNDADLDVAVSASLNGAFFSTGQRCTASSRLVIESGVHDEFVDKLTSAMRGLRVGEALAPKTEVGPVASDEQLRSNLHYIRVAHEEGAEVIGGARLELKKKGFYQAPALFVGADNQMRIAKEEIFGPCASIIKVESFDQALDVANDTEFGLSAGICTTSLKYAREFKRRAEAGMVMVNLPTAGVDYHVPFGGRKGSSYGSREQGRYAAEFYTVVKTSYTTG